MRFKQTEVAAICESFRDVFSRGAMYLFGSRVDDRKKGGDIDLLVVPEMKENAVEKKLDFLVRLKKMIGEQRIDVVIDTGKNRLIDRNARKEGILLWKS
jgi:predicted nucleotidyltransferase